MSGATEGLAHKIAGARDLGAVVRSMKALAASNIGQYERAVAALRDYYHTVELGLGACLRQGGGDAIQAAPSVAGLAAGIVLFGSDQGLVGRFNDVVLEFALRTLDRSSAETPQVWVVGERMQALVAGSGLPVVAVMEVPTSVGGIAALVGRILIAVQASRERGAVGSVHVFHNAPQAAALYGPEVRQLLPLDAGWRRRVAEVAWPTPRVPQVIEGRAAAVDGFIREYLFIVLFQACAESLASENASRLAAMQRAEKNIEEILEELNRNFHRIRQESIDEELFDVVSGYDALMRGRQ